MADKNVSEAAWTLITSFQDANQAVAEYLVSAQERNRKLAKRFFTEVIEVLKANQAAVQGLVATQESGGKHACLAAGVRPADQEAARSPPDPGARTSGVHARCPAHSAGCLSESAWDGGDRHATGTRAGAADGGTDATGHIRDA